MLKIGNIEMNNQVVLAPMAGVCNPAFRLIAKEFGTGLVCAEMVSDKAILHGNKRTMEMLFVDEREKYSYRPNNRIKTKNPVKSNGLYFIVTGDSEIIQTRFSKSTCSNKTV